MQYFHSITDIKEIKPAADDSSQRYIMTLVQEAREYKRILSAEECVAIDAAIQSRDAEALEKALGYR